MKILIRLLKKQLKYEAADKKRKEAIDAKNDAEAIITQTEQAMSEAGDKLAEGDKAGSSG